MTDEGPDASGHFSNLISVYADSIRVSDYKANLAVLFVAIVMGPVIAYHGNYPHFLSLPITMGPFFVAFLCLLLCVFPRFPKRGRRSFPVLREPSESDFVFPETEEDDIEQLKLSCAVLSEVLFWKTLFLKLAFLSCLTTTAASFGLLSYSLLAQNLR
jgi:hypothetical protein